MTSDPCRLKSSDAPRWLSVFLALAVFFLPLHFHAASVNASQVTKECGCLHGTRTQLALAVDALQPALVVECATVVFEQASALSKPWSDPEKARGPPARTTL